MQRVWLVAAGKDGGRAAPVINGKIVEQVRALQTVVKDFSFSLTRNVTEVEEVCFYMLVHCLCWLISPLCCVDSCFSSYHVRTATRSNTLACFAVSWPRQFRATLCLRHRLHP